MPGPIQKYIHTYVLDASLVLVMCGLLYYGASREIFGPYSDSAKYQCYAVAFWRGVDRLRSFPANQCRFISTPTVTNQDIARKMQQYHVPQPLVQFVARQSSVDKFHALPHEYPLLTMPLFTLGLLAHQDWFQVAFAIWMALVAAIIYVTLVRFRSRRAAMAYAVYLVSGGWGTAFGRFDLAPSALTLFALLYAVRTRWNGAFAFLAVATCVKFYPLILLFPFVCAQQMESRLQWTAWRRWLPLGVFTVMCIVVMGVSLCLSVEGTLGPLHHFANRPIQVESFPASLVWLGSLVSHQPLTYTYTFGSLNVFGPLTTTVGVLGTGLLGLGLMYTYWLQGRRKIDLETATLLTLLMVLVTGKVFSPQYLIWVVPLIAYVGETQWWWFVSWTIIGVLTTWIYPYIYHMASFLEVPSVPLFFPVTTIRNFLLYVFVLVLLMYCTQRRPRKLSTSPL